MFNALMLILLTVGQNYPLDEELKSSFSGGNCSVEMICKVTKTGGTYTYMYSIKNKGEKPIKVKWDLVSQAMYCGYNNLDLMLDLEPDENVIFTLQHPDPPLQTAGKVTAFYLTTNEKIEKLLHEIPGTPKGIKTEISKKSIYNSDSGSGYGAVPTSFIVKRKY